jgi:hypothetical protein
MLCTSSAPSTPNRRCSRIPHSTSTFACTCRPLATVAVASPHPLPQPRCIALCVCGESHILVVFCAAICARARVRAVAQVRCGDWPGQEGGPPSGGTRGVRGPGARTLQTETRVEGGGGGGKWQVHAEGWVRATAGASEGMGGVGWLHLCRKAKEGGGRVATGWGGWLLTAWEGRGVALLMLDAPSSSQHGLGGCMQWSGVE